MINPIKHLIRHWQYKRAMKEWRLWLAAYGMDVEQMSDVELLERFSRGWDRLKKALALTMPTVEEAAKAFSDVAEAMQRTEADKKATAAALGRVSKNI